MGTFILAEILFASARPGPGVRATLTKTRPRAEASRCGTEDNLGIMKHSGFSKCFPIIKSVPAVKAGVKKAGIPLGRPGSLCRRGQPA